MTNQIRIVKSEWHQMERRYAMVVSKDDIEAVYPEDEVEQKWADLKSGALEPHEFISDGEEVQHWMEFDWLDEDDLWTDRKGGYDITYEVEEDYEEPLQDWQIIQNLKLEVNTLLAEKNLPKKYPEARSEEEMQLALQELKDEFDRLMAEEDNEEHPKDA